jgi:hypothetical protein
VRSEVSPRTLLAAAVVVLVGLVVLVQRPAGDADPAAPDPAASTQETTRAAPSGPETPEFTGTPVVASVAEFCADFRGLEDLQDQYAAGDVDEDALRESAQGLTAWLARSCPG